MNHQMQIKLKSFYQIYIKPLKMKQIPLKKLEKLNKNVLI